MKINPNQSKEFYKFIVLVLVISFSLFWIYKVSFSPIHEDNKRYIELLIGVITGTLLTTGVNYILKDRNDKDDQDKNV